MGYQRDNRYGGDDRWQGRGLGGRFDERSRYGRDDFGRGGDFRRGGYGDDDRGFFDRAGDEVRSWFGDDDAERRREQDQRRYEREQGMSGRRDNSGSADDDRGRGFGGNRSGGGFFGSGDDRPERGFTGSGNEGPGRHGQGSEFWGSRSDETWSGSGFGGSPDHGRRFDRVDAGSTGTHGAHPMSSAVGGTGYGAGYGTSASGYGSSARSAAIIGGAGARSGGRDFDPHYSEWRQRQIEDLDRDYDEYRREHQSRFNQEFAGWREKRQGQRQSLRRVMEQMEVVGSDGQHVGTVDKIGGDRIYLTKNDENAGGRHHSIPCSWIESVDERVTINKTAEEAMNAWKDEERNRALFEREDQGSEGPHVLNRSFSGTYEDR